MQLSILQKNLEDLGYSVKRFDTKEQACDYLDAVIDNKTVGIGGSVTVTQMGLLSRLETHNEVRCHVAAKAGENVLDLRLKATRSQVYISSVNGISLRGEIVNIDNTGNRVAATTFGCEDVYFIIGQNKVAETLEKAIDRARNIAAPLNAKRLGFKTPCAVKGDKCYDCNSPQRICRNLSVFWKKPTGCRYEIVLVAEDLGY